MSAGRVEPRLYRQPSGTLPVQRSVPTTNAGHRNGVSFVAFGGAARLKKVDMAGRTSPTVGSLSLPEVCWHSLSCTRTGWRVLGVEPALLPVKPVEFYSLYVLAGSAHDPIAIMRKSLSC